MGMQIMPKGTGWVYFGSHYQSSGPVVSTAVSAFGVPVVPGIARPGLTDDDEHLDEVLAACSAAGVRSASPIVLHVRPSIREHFMPWLRNAYPWLYPRYVELYGRRAYAPKSYQTDVAERFARLRLRHGLVAGGGRRPPPREAVDQQLALAV